MTRRWLAVLILLCSTFACNSDTRLIDNWDWPVFLIYGMVSSEGRTIPGTRVELRITSFSSCDKGDPPAAWAVTTDANGWYERLMDHLTPGGSFKGCLEAIATPPPETGLPPLTRREDVDFPVAYRGTVFRFDLIYPD